MRDLGHVTFGPGTLHDLRSVTKSTGLNLAVVVTAGNYNTPDQWIPPIRVVREVVPASIL